MFGNDVNLDAENRNYPPLQSGCQGLKFGMPSDFDATEFVDDDFHTGSKGAQSVPATGADHTSAPLANRAPSREEVDGKVGEMQHKLAELKRVQEELERERAGLEETRRRQIEFQTGRKECVHNLHRAVGLLKEAEFASRRDAEQMARALSDLAAALAKVEATNDQTWTKENFNAELSRSLAVVESARMEWNSARLKFPILSGQSVENGKFSAPDATAPLAGIQAIGILQLCKIGLALTWPLAVVALIVGMMLVLRR